MSDREGQSPARRGHRRHGYYGGAVNSDDDSRRSPEAGEKILFERFENVASSVTKLYNTASWPAFQQAAAAVTLFYKDSVDAYRRGFDAGASFGRQTLCKEILATLQKSSSGHPYIRRDDCVDLVLSLTSAASSASPDDWSQMSTVNAQRASSPSDASAAPPNNLEIFREALNAPTNLTAFFAEECRRHASKRRRDEMDDDSFSPPHSWAAKKRNRRT